MVSPMFFDISANGEPLSYIAFELLKDKVPKTAENFCALSMGKKGSEYNDSSFHIIITDYTTRVVTSHAIMTLETGLSLGKYLRMRTSS
ncbi:hypothetical protein U0070_003073 [Myodes glareolus]|uniref:PPIase cyclophilin-type domain-containing protein n=1 Tax=Myodes glareolus TaxID=447135 RepID=A0AAW0HT45_MYOGA